jgi:hypothetical protein
METNISLKQYQVLPRNQVLKLKYMEEIIYVRPGFIGGSEPKTRINEYWGIFFKIKDLEIYKKDSTNASNLESLPIDSSKINGEIEIIDIV